jgi:TolB-like protein/Tfp pilus assembly protein PilF
MCYTAPAMNGGAMMQAYQGAQRPIRFGAYELDLRTGELRKFGLRLKLQEKPLGILAVLLERPGEVVTREELRQRLWPADIFVDFDHSLSIAVHKLRIVLCDTADNPRFVETLARRGYRFIAPVQKAQPDTARKRIIAVLPMENLSADPQQEFFADGLTEEMIIQLGRLNPHRLGVIARTSAMAYRHTTKSISEIGLELNVQYILEGSVRRSASRVRITAQLIEVDDQTTLWAETYERAAKDLFAIQSDVAERIARSLAIELLPEQKAVVASSASASSEAHELYLRGRYHANKRAEDHYAKAIDYFSQAIDKDPHYALAHSGLADAYSLIGYYGGLSPADAYGRAKKAALTALAINDQLAEPHSSLAFVTLEYDWNWPEADRLHRHAIDLNPNHAPLADWYGLNLMQVGRFHESLAALERAKEVDPVSVVINCHLGWLYYFMRKYDRSVEILRKAMELDSSFALGSWFLAQAYLQNGDKELALVELERTVSASGTHPAALAYLAYTYCLCGRPNDAKKVLQRIAAVGERRRVSPYFMAYAFAALGDPTEVFQWLERAYDEHSGWLIYLPIEPTFDHLRNDRRFVDLTQRVNPYPVRSMATKSSG